MHRINFVAATPLVGLPPLTPVEFAMPSTADLTPPEMPRYRRAADVPSDLRSQSRWRALGRRLRPDARSVAWVDGYPCGAALYPEAATEPLPPKPEKRRTKRAEGGEVEAAVPDLSAFIAASLPARRS